MQGNDYELRGSRTVLPRQDSTDDTLFTMLERVPKSNTQVDIACESAENNDGIPLGSVAEIYSNSQLSLFRSYFLQEIWRKYKMSSF